MKVYVDADACPVVSIVIRLSRARGVPVVLLCDTNHILSDDYAEVRTIDAGRDAVDIALFNLARPGDIVITQDYGVAATVLGKGCHALHQSGMRYTNDNIDSLLMQRHLAREARMARRRNHLHGPAKRTPEDDLHFEQALRALFAEVGSKGTQA